MPKRQQGFLVSLKVKAFFPFDHSDPASVATAAEQAKKIQGNSVLARALQDLTTDVLVVDASHKMTSKEIETP